LGHHTHRPDDETVWGGNLLIRQVPMVVSPSMATGNFLIDPFAEGTILFDHEVLNVQLAFQNEDDFVRNLICLRNGLAVPVPAGVLKGTLPAMATAAHVANAKK
jgi:hypothetical protein